MPVHSRRRNPARSLLNRARQAPQAVRRLRSSAHRGPALSVVVPVYNVGEWIRPALDSLVSQSLEDLEIIVVDDGSTDGSVDVVRSYAARDDRIRIITQENAGLGAARNTGTEHATGEYIAFFDSDDLLAPDAYRAMVDRLRSSGSDFVTGSYARGDEHTAVKPNWVARTMGSDRTRLTIVDEPDLLLDITAWNKVFRRSFWEAHDLRFIEGVRYEDQVPITRAYLTAGAFDVLRQRVYVWRTRLDGSSITQQKSTIADLTDRLRSQQECAELVRDADPAVRRSWYLKLLDYDLPNYLLAALSADQDYVTLLQGSLERLRAEVPTEVWGEVAFRNRAQSWVLSNGRLDLGVELRAWFEREPGGLPTRVREGHVEYVVPSEVVEDDLPLWLRRVQDVDVRPVVRLTATRWDGDDLVLRGSAFMTPLAVSASQHDLELDLVDPDGTVVAAASVTRFEDETLDALARMTYADMSASGFEARIDAECLARDAPAGQAGLQLRFTQSQDGFRRTSEITHVLALGSGVTRQPHQCRGRMVRLAGVLETGHRVLVHDTYSWTVDHRGLDDGKLELTLLGPPDDRVTGVELGSSRGQTALPFETGDRGTTRVQVSPGSGERLTTEHASGRRCVVLWGEEPNVLGSAGLGGFLHRGVAQAVSVDAARPAVSVTHVGFGRESLRLEGTALGVEGDRLRLVGPRGSGTASSPVGSGDFVVEVPLTQDPWGLGRTAVPPGTYELELVPAEGRPARTGYAYADSSLRARLPMPADLGDQDDLHVTVGMTNVATLQVEVTELSVQQESMREQHRLRAEVYPQARARPRRRSVLLECFAGTSTGDSPAAVARELVRRDSGLDLVWSVVDRSVRVPAGTRGVVRFSAEWYDLLGSSAYVVNNANFPHFFRKAPGQVYLQTWHGTPLKLIANDMPNRRFFSVTYMRTMDYEASTWDYLISPSPFCSEVLPRAFGYDGPVLESGYPRNDALVEGEPLEAGRAVRLALGISEDQRVLLYAPTWRESARTTDGHSKVLYVDPLQLARDLPDTVVLVRGHANTAGARSVTGSVSDRVLDVTLYPDINDLFLASDALVTDYSSVMFDYAVLDRPIMLLVPDLRDYRDRLRGFYFDLEEVAPGPLLADQESLVAHLRSDAYAEDGHAEARRAFRERFAPWDDGAAAARVVDAVFGEVS